MFDIKPHLGIFSAESGEVFDDDHIDFSSFNVRHHLFELGSFEVCSAPSIITINTCNGDSVFCTVLFQQCFLRVDLSRVNSAKCSKLINCYLSLFINNKGLPIDTAAPSACRETRFIVQSWTGFLAYNSQIRIM